MKLVFHKRDLNVISLLDDDLRCDSNEWLKSVYPEHYKELDMLEINDKLFFNPINLRVKMDNKGCPESIWDKNKIIYNCSKKDIEEHESRTRKIRQRKAERKISRTFLRSITSDITNMWINSSRTDLSVIDSLKSFKYFIDQDVIPVSWWGPFTDAGGYANMNREIILRLHNYYVIPKIQICPTAPQITALTKYQISRYMGINISRFKNHPRVWSFTPIPHPPHKGLNIYFTMMETETLHPDFVRICNANANEVWVPSNHNKKVFSDSGVKVPIQVMPLGIDETLYKSEQNKKLGYINDFSNFESLLGKPPEKGINAFKFLSLFGWSYRKGPDVLIKSFVEEFDSKDDVVLIIVSRHSGSSAHQHINVIKQEVLKYAYAIRSFDLPQIILYPHVIPESKMPDCYRMGHAFVHTSRGEGFSLPQIEASACGLPIISCNNTGMGHYLRDDNAFLIKTDDKEICSPEMHWITSYYHGQLFPKLGWDQIQQTRKHMNYVLNNYDKSCKKGQILTQEVFDQYTWQHATRRIAKRIKDIV